MKKNSEKSIAQKREKSQYIEDLIKEVQSDFKKRQKQRLFYERQWELNINFLNGNQYCEVDSRGELTEQGKTFYWQNKEVFNHIAPIINTRLSKFSCIMPTLSVRPETDDDKDVAAASFAEKLLESAFKKTNLEKRIP